MKEFASCKFLHLFVIILFINQQMVVKLGFSGEVGVPPLVGATLCGRPLK